MEGARADLSFFIPAAIVNLAAWGTSPCATAPKGLMKATATACTTSAHSIGDSFRIIQHKMLMSCRRRSEAAIRPWAWVGSQLCALFPLQ